MSDLVKCPHCNKDIENDSFFCDQCGKELMLCPQCNIFAKGKFCSRCRTQLVPASSKGAGQAPVAQPGGPAPQASGSYVGQPGGPAPQASGPYVGQPGGPTPQASGPYVGQPGGPTPQASGPCVGQPGGPAPQASGSYVGQPGGPAAASPVSQQAATSTATSSAQSTVRQAPATGPSRMVCRQAGITLQLVNGAIIGRRNGNYVQQFSNQPYVSGTHASLSNNGMQWYITDMGSTNGTCVNGRSLAPNQATPFNVGDMVRIATLDFVVE